MADCSYAPGMEWALDNTGFRWPFLFGILEGLERGRTTNKPGKEHNISLGQLAHHDWYRDGKKIKQIKHDQLTLTPVTITATTGGGGPSHERKKKTEFGVQNESGERC